MKKVNRRNFIGLGAAFVAGCASDKVGFPAITAVRSPNGLLRHACIGVGNKGKDDWKALMTHPKIEIAALCDVDANYLAVAKKQFPNARVYRDWREMIEAEGDKIDSVNISLPDHNHVIAADWCYRRRKHIYLQKPLCKTLAESKFLRDEAKKAGVVTQMGAQFNASPNDRLCVELLKAQALGPVEEVHFFSTRKGLSRRKRYLPASVPVPKHLDWDLWLGTAPVRDYAPEVYHPLIWRVWHDFGSGWIGDIGCHLMSAVWRGMDLGSAAPLGAWAETGTQAEDNVKDVTWPTMAHIVYDFAGVPASAGKPFKFKWYDGCAEPDNLAPAQFRPPVEVEKLFAESPLKKRPHEGKAIKCRDGWILHPHGNTKNLFAMRNDGTPIALPELSAAPSHYHEYVDACLEGRPATTDFAWSTYMMDTVLVGAAAERVAGTSLKWDPVSRTFGHAQADKLLRPSYRKGWEVAGL